MPFKFSGLNNLNGQWCVSWELFNLPSIERIVSTITKVIQELTRELP